MLEEMIITHCAPTLAGMKTANLFNYKIESELHLNREIASVNEKLNIKGVSVDILKISENRALIYVYRKHKLLLDLMQPEARNVLKAIGYQGVSVEESLDQLKDRIAVSDDFPHEIGLFLNYPVQDVLGFIEQKGKNFKYSGLWKVYGNENEAIKLFAKFKKCTKIYAQVFANGRSLTQLTVAA